MQSTQEVLNVLRGAARELGSASSQPGTPRAQGAGDGDMVAAPPSTAHLLLQISALHKAFLALSEAFMEEISQRGVEREEQRAAVESVRRECFAKLQATAALQVDIRQLAEADGQAAAAQLALEQRCSQLERELARARWQAEEGRQAAEAAAVQAATSALQQQVEEAVARQLAAAQPTWAAEVLPPLLQPLQDAVEATAELAAQVVGDVASLAGQVQQLVQRCQRGEAAHSNHEQRLCLLEEAGMGGSSGGGSRSCVPAEQVQQLQQAVHSLQLGHSRMDESLQQVRQLQQEQQVRQLQQEQQGQEGWRQQQRWEQEQQRWQQGSSPAQLLHQAGIAASELHSLAAAAAELPALQQALAAVAEQQAQQARTTEELVQSVLADVTSLARHTKALDKELRSLRREAQQTQQALLQSCSTFSRALAIPSPVGPFTSFPPQP